MSNNRINYAVCDGIIEQFGIWGACDYWRVRVSYTVDGKTYSLTESVKLVSKTIRLGPIPIGQKKEPKLPTTEVGGRVAVCYDPEAPQKAFLRDNQGLMND